MDGDPTDFRALELEAIFERGDDEMDLVHGQVVGKGAVAGQINVLG